jgi:MFS transporter, DHA2 family, multidrug resistance protein
MSDPRVPDTEPKADLKTWMAVMGSVIGAFIAVLNIQITNASLPNIQGAIGAGIDDGGWISTSYLVAEIVVIPLTAFLTPVFSLRRYLLGNTIMFLVMSVACAFAHNLSEMIALRALQGFFGGVLIPMAFTITLTMLPWQCSPCPRPSPRRLARRSAAILPRTTAGSIFFTLIWSPARSCWRRCGHPCGRRQ